MPSTEIPLNNLLVFTRNNINSVVNKGISQPPWIITSSDNKSCCSCKIDNVVHSNKLQLSNIF
jgi:hypothetical protein